MLKPTIRTLVTIIAIYMEIPGTLSLIAPLKIRISLRKEDQLLQEDLGMVSQLVRITRPSTSKCVVKAVLQTRIRRLFSQPATITEKTFWWCNMCHCKKTNTFGYYTSHSTNHHKDSTHSSRPSGNQDEFPSKDCSESTFANLSPSDKDFTSKMEPDPPNG